MTGKPIRSPTLWSWAFYDWANSGFALVVMTALFPVFFADYWAGDMPDDQSTFWFGLGASAAGLLTAAAAPFLGAYGDVRKQRKRLLLAFMAVGVAGTAAMYPIGRGQWVIALAAYVVSAVAFAVGNLFYDSLLRGLTRPENRHTVSAAGFALGYFGSTFLLVGSMWLVQSPETFGIPDENSATRIAFLITAGWWLLFSLPLAFFVPEPGAEDGNAGDARTRDSLRQLMHMLRAAWRRPELRWFLIAFFFYVDGINTVAKMALKLGSDLDFERFDLLMALVIAQLSGVPFTLLFGFIGQRYRPHIGLYAGLVIYLMVIGYAWQMRVQPLELLGFSVLPIHILGFLIGMAQGGMLTLSRSFFSNLIPEAQAGTFFGLYNVIGKASSVLGPVYVGAVTLLGGATRTGILALGVFFVLGFAFLVPATRAAERAEKTRSADGRNPTVKETE